MKTGMRVEIRQEDLTHTFVWNGKTILIGRFDPSAYPKMANVSISRMNHHIFDQLEDSKELTEEEMSAICELSNEEFNACIKERE